MAKGKKRIRKRPRKACGTKVSSSKKIKSVTRMAKKELKKYKERLLKEKELITGEIQHITKDTLNKSPKDATGDLSGYTYHIADLATDSYDREFSLGIASSEIEILYEINDALKRIDDGAYGNCLECSKPITRERLKAVPHAKYCIKCQQRLEKDKTGS